MAMDMLMGRAAPPPSAPPDLAALLGAGGGPGGGAPSGGPDLQGQPVMGGVAAELDALDAISQAIDAYLQVPTVDESEKLIAEKMSTMVQQLKASNQKMVDQSTGASPSLRKALGGP